MSVVASIRSNAAGILSLNNRPALPVPVTSNIMLKHEDNPQPQAPSQSAAQVRVTPEELAAAVTALQIRKEGSPGTIAIGDAVDELGLDATPEEVLAEVEARRVAKARPFSQKRLKVLLAALAALVGMSVWGISQRPPDNPSYNVHTVPNTYASLNKPGRIYLDSTLLVGDASGKIMMLSEVGDDQPVHCTYDLRTGGFSQYTPGNAQILWTLVKHGGKVYVRGHMQKMSPKVFSVLGADVTSIDNDPQFSIPVTLPIDGFTVEPGAGSAVEFHANDVHLDKYAYEKW